MNHGAAKIKGEGAKVVHGAHLNMTQLLYSWATASVAGWGVIYWRVLQVSCSRTHRHAAWRKLGIERSGWWTNHPTCRAAIWKLLSENYRNVLVFAPTVLFQCAMHGVVFTHKKMVAVLWDPNVIPAVLPTVSAADLLIWFSYKRRSSLWTNACQ